MSKWRRGCSHFHRQQFQITNILNSQISLIKKNGSDHQQLSVHGSDHRPWLNIHILESFWNVCQDTHNNTRQHNTNNSGGLEGGLIWIALVAIYRIAQERLKTSLTIQANFILPLRRGISKTRLDIIYTFLKFQQWYQRSRHNWYENLANAEICWVKLWT